MMLAKAVAPVLCAAALLPACATALESAAADPAPRQDALVFTRIPATAESAAVELPLGSHIARLDLPDAAHPFSRITNLTPDFAAAGRPDISFDGQRVLFIGQRTRDDCASVWEMNADGTSLRQIIAGSAPCSAAIYVSTIYTLDADEPVYQLAFCAGPGQVVGLNEPGAVLFTPTAALFTCRLDGSRIQRITFAPDGVSDPYLLSDGRLLYTGRASLFSVNTDGTEVSLFAAADAAVARCGRPCETADGWVTYVESGALVAVRRARSLHTRRLVAAADEGLYDSASPLPGGRLLVSFRSRTDLSYGLYVLEAEKGVRNLLPERPEGCFAQKVPDPFFRRVTCLVNAPEWHELDGHVLGPRPIPAGRSSVVSESSTTGFAYGLNAYLSDTKAGQHIAPGEIRRLQVFRAVQPADAPSVRSRTPSAELLGEVPVESDGSFFLEVPARVPLRWQTLGADGTVLQAMQSWVWVMPREGRGCIGCHEDRELAPPNRFTLALRAGPRRVGIASPPEQSPPPAAGRPESIGAGGGAGPVAQEPELPLYVGQAVCGECHAPGCDGGVCSIPPVPAHAQACSVLDNPESVEIAALSGITGEPRRSVICLGCHAAAAEEGPRWTAGTFSLADGVQCETCHGAGSLHIAQPTAGATLRHVDRLMCGVCHRELPSHAMVLEKGYVRSPVDAQYKTPVNLAASPDGARLYVVCEHSNSLLVVDPATGAVQREIPVGLRPNDVAVSPDGRTLFVTNRLSDSVAVIDTAAGQVVAEIAVGDEPHGVVLDTTGQQLFVLNTGENSISVIDTAARTELRRLAAGCGPWSAARTPDGASLYVTSVRPDLGGFCEPYRSEITVIDAARGIVRNRESAPDANMLKGIACIPAGPYRGVALFVMMRTKNLVPTTRVAQGWVITNGLGLLWPDGRVDQVLLDQPAECFPDPEDVAISPDGRYALVTSGGSDQVAVVDVEQLGRSLALPDQLGLSDRFVLKRLKVGRNPRSVIFAPDGRSAYVANALDDSITVIETTGFTVSGVLDLGGPREVTELRRGARLFHSADMTFAWQFSCQSCHPDGHLNGLAMDIEADGIGLRPVDNRTLRGILDTGPFKWEGLNPTMQRQCGPRFAVFFTRLAPYPPAELDALVRYMCTIERSPNRYRPADGLTPAQYRGKLVFERTSDNSGQPLRPEQQCLTCHNGPYKTAQINATARSTMWLDERMNVPLAETGLPGSKEFGDLGIFFFADTGVRPNLLDVPQLSNLYDSPPYLHNGGANTLEEIWTRFNYTEAHGLTRDLTRRQFNDLMAYLRAL